MKITDIKQQQKRSERYSVYIDGKFSFGISEGQLLQHGLHTGQEITETELETLQQEAEFSKAYERAINYISIRPRSEQEIIDYMKRKAYAAGVAKNVLDKLKELELIDDASFARSWVQWRQSAAPRSRRKLYQELRQKGVADDVIEQELEGIDVQEQIQAARSLIAKKGRRYEDRQKLMAYLSRQGFPYDVIRQAFEDEE